MSERRRFSRILYLTMADLGQGDKTRRTQLVDVSLQWALRIRPDDWESRDNKDYALGYVKRKRKKKKKKQKKQNKKASKKK